MNSRTPLVVSAAVFAVMLATSAWAWFQLPPGTPIPIHWGIDGQADGFAHGRYALFVIPFMTALITIVFWGIPAIEPRRLNLVASSKFYRAAWTGAILLLALTHGVALYAALHAGLRVGSVILAAVCLLLIVIGNYMGKTRSMFLGGVRTPWTLSSEYSWQRTNSLAGKMFVAAGAVGFAAAVALPGREASHVFLTAIAAAIVLSIVASYVYWRRDPERSPQP
ncbi:MAG: SdpI family protein [Rhizomicrobium sp.]